jgi:hypothetical protein
LPNWNLDSHQQDDLMDKLSFPQFSLLGDGHDHIP